MKTMNSRTVKGNTLEIRSEHGHILQITEEMAEGTMYIKIAGEIVNECAHDFEDELMAAFSVCNQIKLDLSGITYIASIALRTLLSVQQIVDEHEGASLILTELSPEVHRVFEESGFMEILEIEKK